MKQCMHESVNVTLDDWMIERMSARKSNARCIDNGDHLTEMMTVTSIIARKIAVSRDCMSICTYIG